jgi:hypothetical protein
MKAAQWSIPRAHEGRTVAVLASGPSMTCYAADLLRAARLPAIVVNTTHRLAPWAWALYAADCEWWLHPSNADALGFQGLKVSCQPVTPAVLQLRIAGRTGYDDAQDCVHTYSNSGAQAVQIAAKSGASRILLLGFDMHRNNGDHWHGAHPPGLRNTTDALYVKFVAQYAELAPHLAARGVDVVNCSEGSALTAFRKAPLAAVLEDEACLAR